MSGSRSPSWGQNDRMDWIAYQLLDVCFCLCYSKRLGQLLKIPGRVGREICAQRWMWAVPSLPNGLANIRKALSDIPWPRCLLVATSRVLVSSPIEQPGILPERTGSRGRKPSTATHAHPCHWGAQGQGAIPAIGPSTAQVVGGRGGPQRAEDRCGVGDGGYLVSPSLIVKLSANCKPWCGVTNTKC